jgi:hypothetical protein
LSRWHFELIEISDEGRLLLDPHFIAQRCQ